MGPGVNRLSMFRRSARPGVSAPPPLRVSHLPLRPFGPSLTLLSAYSRLRVSASPLRIISSSPRSYSA